MHSRYAHGAIIEVRVNDAVKTHVCGNYLKERVSKASRETRERLMPG